MSSIRCHRCRNEVGEDDRFCAGCGAPQSADATRDELFGLTGILPVGRSVPSIVAGYLGLFSWTIVLAPFALALGAYAFWDLKRRPHLLGRGRAVFAMAAGASGLLFGVWMVGTWLRSD